MFAGSFSGIQYNRCIASYCRAVLKSVSNPDIFSLFSANPNDYSILDFTSNTILVVMLFPFIAGLVAFILLVKPLNSRTLEQS